jgi:fucose permease
LQSTFFRLLYDQRSIFHLEELDAKNKGAIILSLVGVFGAAMQGGILPRVLPKFGEIKLLRIGLILLVPGLFFVPYSPLWGGIIFVVACQGIGSGLTQPTISALVSKSAPARIQGGIFGVTQALGALARLVGPLFASPLFARNVASPYWLASLAILFPLFAAWTLKPPATQAVTA